MNDKILTHYSLFQFREGFWGMEQGDRKTLAKSFLKDVTSIADASSLYQVYPSQTEYDILVWNNCRVDDLLSVDSYMGQFAKAVNKYRAWVSPKMDFWGMTKPSVYSKAKKSAQEIDPFEGERLPYFIIYPFTKTAEWYLQSREDRQEMMNEHMRVGKSYPEITQLLLYSFGLQNQEFIVAYEAKDLSMFSDLVYELRGSKARLYTLSDIPIITGMLRSSEDLVKLLAPKF